jgi:hypothetical protein
LSSIAGGATLDGATQLTVTIVNDDVAAPSGGGGGGAMSLLFVAILALLLCGSGFSRDVSSG